MKIITISGKKNSGKTTLTTKIIKELKKRNYKVATIKHSHHTIEMDKENTDTWKHKQAGSNIVVGIGSTTFFNIKQDLDLNRLLFLIKHLDNIDYVIIEGFKKYNYPKIATSPEAVDKYTIKKVNTTTMTDTQLKELIDLIETRTHDITNTIYANNCGYNNGEEIAKDIRNGKITNDKLDKTHSYLSIDGKIVGLNKFVSNYLKQTVIGTINTLNLKEYGITEIKNIELLIPESNTRKKTKNSNIKINNEPLNINQFTNKLIKNSITSMIKSLKTPENINTITIEISEITKNIENANITLKINNKQIKINKFTQTILKETIYAQINTLKTNEIKNIKINIG